MSSRTTGLIVLVAYEVALVSTMPAILSTMSMLVMLMRVMLRVLLVHAHLISKALVAGAIGHAMGVEGPMTLRVHAVRVVRWRSGARRS